MNLDAKPLIELPANQIQQHGKRSRNKWDFRGCKGGSIWIGGKPIHIMYHTARTKGGKTIGHLS